MIGLFVILLTWVSVLYYLITSAFNLLAMFLEWISRAKRLDVNLDQLIVQNSFHCLINAFGNDKHLYLCREKNGCCRNNHVARNRGAWTWVRQHIIYWGEVCLSVLPGFGSSFFHPSTNLPVRQNFSAPISGGTFIICFLFSICNPHFHNYLLWCPSDRRVLYTIL